MSKAPPRVDYAPRLSVWKRRSFKRQTVFVLAFGAACLAAWLVIPEVWRRWVLVDAQRRCLTSTAPPAQVAFDDDPGRGASLMAADARYVLSPQRGVMLPSKDWTRFAGLYAPPGVKDAAILFLGERVTPNGVRRLVVVTGVPENFFDGSTSRSLTCYALVVAPGSFRNSPRTLSNSFGGVPLTPLDQIRCFAGQPDPNDPSHFTVHYAGDKTAGFLDGYLRDDDTVKLEKRPITPPPPPSAASPPAPD